MRFHCQCRQTSPSRLARFRPDMFPLNLIGSPREKTRKNHKTHLTRRYPADNTRYNPDLGRGQINCGVHLTPVRPAALLKQAAIRGTSRLRFEPVSRRTSDTGFRGQ